MSWCLKPTQVSVKNWVSAADWVGCVGCESRAGEIRVAGGCAEVVSSSAAGSFFKKSLAVVNEAPSLVLAMVLTFLTLCTGLCERLIPSRSSALGGGGAAPLLTHRTAQKLNVHAGSSSLTRMHHDETRAISRATRRIGRATTHEENANIYLHPIPPTRTLLHVTRYTRESRTRYTSSSFSYTVSTFV